MLFKTIWQEAKEALVETKDPIPGHKANYEHHNNLANYHKKMHSETMDILAKHVAGTTQNPSYENFEKLASLAADAKTHWNNISHHQREANYFKTLWQDKGASKRKDGRIHDSRTA